MRIVKEIPHRQFKITIFSWNGKFQIKIELDQYEQVFKINEQDVEGIDDVVNMLDADFLKTTMHRFLTMRSDFTESFKRKNFINE
ncbi:MAG: hypothetical protein HOL28_03100 [Crocinitomicaceae bacterium]|nr:hypothetical protein [Crocinitomicaceae bacterium]MBT5402411.1 hypothetical protein [Crocinitomicaceae bacterium]